MKKEKQSTDSSTRAKTVRKVKGGLAAFNSKHQVLRSHHRRNVAQHAGLPARFLAFSETARWLTRIPLERHDEPRPSTPRGEEEKGGEYGHERRARSLPGTRKSATDTRASTSLCTLRYEATAKLLEFSTLEYRSARLVERVPTSWWIRHARGLHLVDSTQTEMAPNGRDRQPTERCSKQWKC